MYVLWFRVIDMWIMFLIVSNEGHSSAISPQTDSSITVVLFDAEQPSIPTYITVHCPGPV